MGMPRISFSWKPTISGRERWRWGLFMMVPSKSGRRQRLRIMVRGLLLWLAGLAVMAYVAAASALFVWLDRRPHNLVTWSDCLLVPVRWDEIQRKRGDSYITAGLAAMEAMNWSEAVLKIQAGLVKSPDNRSGRQRLAYFFIAAGQRERGLKLLLEGMQRGFPGRETVEAFIEICLAGEDYALALEGLESCLQQSGAAVQREHQWLVEQKARVLMVDGRYEAALRWVAEQPESSDLLEEVRVVALLSLKRFDDAHAALADWGARATSAANSGVLRIGVRLARESGDLAEMRALLDRMQERAPTDPTPWIYRTVQEWLAGNEAAAMAAQDTFFMRFETRPVAMLRMAQPLVEAQAWPLFHRLAERARLLGVSDVRWQQLQFEAAMKQQRYGAALALVEAMEPEDDSTPAARRLRFWRDLQRAYATHLSTGETRAGEELLQIARTGAVALPALKSMAVTHERAGQPMTALQLMELAAQRFPGSEDVRSETQRLRQLVGETERVALALPEIPDGAPLDLDDVRGEQTAVSTDHTRLLGSARLFLQRCDELIEAQSWGELEGLLRDLRQQRPPWMNANTAELLVREIELNLGQRDWPALLTNVRFRLDGSLNRALEIMNVVRRLDAEGERAAAQRVLAEVERRYESFAPARRLREDWATADAAAAEAEDGG